MQEGKRSIEPGSLLPILTLVIRRSNLILRGADPLCVLGTRYRLIYINVVAAIAGDEKSSAERRVRLSQGRNLGGIHAQNVGGVAAAIVVLATAAAGVAVAEKVYNIPTIVKIAGIQWFNRMDTGVKKFAADTKKQQLTKWGRLRPTRSFRSSSSRT